MKQPPIRFESECLAFFFFFQSDNPIQSDSCNILPKLLYTATFIYVIVICLLLSHDLCTYARIRANRVTVYNG